MGVSDLINNTNTLGNAGNLSNLGQANINILGGNIPAIPIISYRDYFLTILETWLGSIPTNNQFIVLIETFPNALVKDWMAGLVDAAGNAIAQAGKIFGIDTGTYNLPPIQKMEPINGDTDAWAINTSGTLLTSYPFQRIIGCVFAQGFSIPNLDRVETQDISVANNGGLIPGVIMGNRAGYAQNRLTLEFLETNTSFADIIIRPWSILASHYGLVARNPNDKNEKLKDIKTNIIIMEYTRSYQSLSQIPRKVWSFYGCAPVEVSERQNVMKQSDEVKSYKTQWVFQKYNMKNNLYLPIPDLLQKINSGNWNNILAI